MTIPRELDDAATIDGCSRIAILWRIIMPLSKAAFATIGIFTFMGQWNSYIWPLIVTNSEEMRMISVGISMFRDQFNTQWTLMMAASNNSHAAAFGSLLVCTALLYRRNYAHRSQGLTVERR